MDELGKSGYLRIANELERTQVASILFKNGYTVRTVRNKKNGKTYEYFVYYCRQPLDIQYGGTNESQI